MQNLAIIGCGDVAFRTYIPGIQAIADRATVIAAFDPVGERAERAAALFPGATAYTAYDDLLAHDGIDGVFNLTPAPFHRDTTARALDAGLHVFSEKPLAATIADGEALIAHARRVDRLLLCAPAVMATGRFRWLSRLIEEGTIGRVHLATARMANMGPAGWRDYTGDPAVFYSKDVGPMIDTAVYVLHAITGLIGPARRVQAFGGIAIPERTIEIPRIAGGKITVESNDVMMIHLDFGENRFAQILSSFAVPFSNAPALELHGAGGSISIGMNGWYDAWGPVDLFKRAKTPNEQPMLEQDIYPPDRPHAEDHLIGAGPAHFVACLDGAASPILSAEHALHVLEIMLAATAAAANGQTIALWTTF